MKERVEYLDIMRSLACVLVVLTHCVPPAPAGQTQSAIYAFISFICSPSPDLFMAISGALILPVALSTGEFMKRRFMRIVPPLFLWSAAFVCYNWLSHTVSPGEALRTFVFIPISPALGVYWFLYVILGFYLFAPIVSGWLKGTSTREVGCFILLWGVTLVLGSAARLFILPAVTPSGNYYFILHSFGGFLGFMILGSYLRNHTGRRTIVKNVVVPLIIIAAVLLSAAVVYKLGIPGRELFGDNLSPVAALMVWAYFMLLKDIRVGSWILSKLISDFSACSFGIYLVHIFIARGVVWSVLTDTGIMNCHPLAYISVSLVLSLALSWGVVRLIRFLPFGKYIVG